MPGKNIASLSLTNSKPYDFFWLNQQMTKSRFIYELHTLLIGEPFYYDCFLISNEATSSRNPKDFPVSLGTLKEITGFDFLNTKVR